ncbi:prepilin peptidase [Agrobacterium albertimagni AOL15]|uniref:Prepilin peptidase n=1 Tax=Agrobacterium albertimagni AOL15 TaxID=1156935 RepID=K2PI85_9HYPH|nr:prepilin peptidase [Agrobacterium albertimagni]EKF60593.1 prepilin peptidase [Agrobacterium albertimagni AOL15]
MYSAIVFIVLPACLVLAALTDFLEMTIPNWISLLLIGAFVLIAPFSGLSLVEFGWHLAAALLVFLGCFALFALNVMGGGDAKLLTAAALWFGFNTSLFEFLVYTGYLGGLLTIVVMLLRANWDKLATVGVRLPQTLMVAKKIPYAIAIGGAGLLAYPSSPLVVAAIQKAL